MEQTTGFGDKASNERIGDGAATELIWAGKEREAALGRMGLGHWAGGAPVDGFGWAGARAGRYWRRACGWIWLGGSSSRKGLGVAACSGGKGSEKDAPAVRSSGDFGVRRRRARAGFQQQVGFGGSRRRAHGGRQRLRRGGMEAGRGGTARSLRGSGSSGAAEGAPGAPGGALEEPRRPTPCSFLALCLLGWAEMQGY